VLSDMPKVFSGKLLDWNCREYLPSTRRDHQVGRDQIHVPKREIHLLYPSLRVIAAIAKPYPNFLQMRLHKEAEEFLARMMKK
jgi:hypothetical protein